MKAKTLGEASTGVDARAWVIHPEILSDGRPERSAEGRLSEAVELAKALGLDVAGGEIARLKAPRAGWLFGSGKIEEIGARLQARDIGLVLIDGAISPKQQQNLEKAWKLKILDRTGLILEIFGARARTREGALQVELAHLEYQRGRLVRSWTHLERQRGGLGFVGGPGETQIEADRRALDERMVKIRRQLETTVRTRGLHRGARRRIPYPTIAFVGYTNAGKSTLFNRITGAEVFAKDMLFATLDPTMRAARLPAGREAVLSDTVGFISDLPTQLIAAFRATLEEVLEADLIVHVRDASHPDAEAQDEDVRTTLRALGLDELQLAGVVTFHNKIDLLAEDARTALCATCERRDGDFALSALTGVGVEAAMRGVEEIFSAGERVARFRFPHCEGEALAWIHRNAIVIERVSSDDWIDVKASADAAVFDRFTKRFPAIHDLT